MILARHNPGTTETTISGGSILLNTAGGSHAFLRRHHCRRHPSLQTQGPQGSQSILPCDPCGSLRPLCLKTWVQKSIGRHDEHRVRRNACRPKETRVPYRLTSRHCRHASGDRPAVAAELDDWQRCELSPSPIGHGIEGLRLRLQFHNHLCAQVGGNS